MQAMKLNQHTQALVEWATTNSEPLRLRAERIEGGGQRIDFGCGVRGGIEAGLLLSRICLANLAHVALAPSDSQLGPYPILQVHTDAPSMACMGSQYAGWKISQGDFFAMGSGPMRAKRGREGVLEALSIQDASPCAIGVLECESLPGREIFESVAAECRVHPSEVTLCVAPTQSIAGVMQVVARSIETAMHKLFELGFGLDQIVSGVGTAPIPPVAKDFVQGIGRTNDAILYGGHVTLWLDGEDECLVELGPKIPSKASSDYGHPFAVTFKQYGYDFYKVDPGLFAPAMITLVNLRSGRSYQFGQFNASVLRDSFGTAQA